MAEQNRKLGKYTEAFESVLSSADSVYQPNSEGKNKSIPATKMSIKRKKKDLGNTTLSNVCFGNNKGAKKKKETAKDRMLRINNFYSNNTFGIWIQCTKCDKWRKVMQYEEEHEVPEDWCCSMNISGIRSCDEPEDTRNTDFSPVNFIPGAIVWAKYSGYPWWPGMIEDDPDVEEYYWIEKNGKCGYHVTFLDDRVTRAWVPGSFVRHYLDPPKYKYLSASYSKYSPLIAQAEIKAKRALNMTIQQRLENFSFAHRFKGKWGSPLKIGNLNENEDEVDLTQMLLEEVNDIESTKSTDSDYRSVSSFELKKNEIDKESEYCKISAKDDFVNNIECKKNQVKRNKLPTKTQLKKEDKSHNEDDTADFKIKVEEVKLLNKQIGEDFYLDKIVPNTTEGEDSNLLIFQKPKDVKHTHLKSVKKKNPRANKNISKSVETSPENCLTKDSSKFRKTNALMKTSKAINKAEKFEILDEKISSTEDEKETKSSYVKKHTEDAKIMNPIKKKNTTEKKLKNSSNSKFKPPLKNNENHTSETKISEEIVDEEITDCIIKEQNLKEKNEMAGKHLEGNKQLSKTSNAKCSSMEKKASKYEKKVENNKSIEENLKSENNLKKKNVVTILKKNLKSSLEKKSASLEESKSHASNDSETVFSKITAEDNTQQNKTNEKNNFLDNFTSSEARDKGKNCIKRNKRTTNVISRQKRKIMKLDSLTHKLSIPVTKNSKFMDGSPRRQNSNKKEEKGLKTDETKNGKEEMKQNQENELIYTSGDDNTVQDTLFNEDANKENFSLSVKMNLQESEEEDSDPFEAE